MLRKTALALLMIVMPMATIAIVGCGGNSGPTAPEKFAPPPSEKDEVSSDKG